jgi:ABC-type glycerol-3-phosphate transport system substrate-binding protein
VKGSVLATGALLAVGALLTTCACSSSTQQATGPVTVTVMTWESNATNTAIDQALAGFHDSNITVKRIDSPSGNYGDKLVALNQAKKLPDLFWCGNDTEQQYSGQGVLTDWSSRMSGSGDFSASRFVPSAMENWKTGDGKVGGVPSLMNTYGIWYNADAFAAAGVTVPAAGWTWDQMFSDAAALAHKNGASYGLIADNMTSTDGPFTLSTYALSGGGAPFTDSVNRPTKVTADPTFTTGVGKLAAAIQSGAVAPPGYDASNAQSLFAAGKIPMLLSGQWLAAGFLTDKPKIKYGFAAIPQVGKPATLYDAVGICTPSYTRNADATFKVLQYLDSTVWTKVLATSPVAPPAYTAAQDTYFSTLNNAGLPTVAATVKTELTTSTTIGVRFTTQWASQASDLITAYWQPILAGKKPLSDLQTMTSKINDLVKSNG